jgi:uroporphyrinogen-III synthase
VLGGRRVAVTRPDPGELGDRLAMLGAIVVHVPLIEIGAPADGGAALASAVARLPSFDWLVVTSVNGASRVGTAVAAHRAVRLAAVGPATASTLAELAGRPVDLVPAVHRAEGLLAEFPSGPARVLLPQADRAGPQLADGLAAKGCDVEVVHAYSTLGRRPSPAERSALAGLDAVVFASGSAVTAWVAAGDLALPPVVVAIGPSTERAARHGGVPITHVSPAPEPQAVVDVLVAALR